MANLKSKPTWNYGIVGLIPAQSRNGKEKFLNIYVGNLSYEVSEQDLQEAFQSFGQVASVAIIKDKFTNQSKGFGFVEMPSKSDAESAIAGLNGKELKGRALSVNEARPKADRPSGGRQGRGPRYR
jgi:RNA recognition motif-containing protein